MAKESSIKIMVDADQITEKDFKKRECIRIIPETRDKERCCCGRKLTEHGAVEDASKSSPEWSIADCTRKFATDAYGFIEFHGGPHPHKAHFVRLSFDSKPADVIRLLEERWKMGRPKLVISVYGSPENFELHPKLAKVFSKGLVKTVKTIDAWIICSGLDSGVSKYVSAAFATAASRRVKQKAVMIGIAPWGMLKNRDDFLLKKAASDDGCIPENVIADGVVVPYHSRESRAVSLSAGFTHMLLVDNGTSNRFGADLVFRRRLEEYLRQQILIESNQQRVPVVGVLLKGGVATMRRIFDFVSNDPVFPMVVLGGSGGAADLLAIAECFNEENGPLKPQLKTQIIARIRAELNIRKVLQSEWIFHLLMLFAGFKKEMNIFRLDDTRQEFDTALLSAYLNAQQRKPMVDVLALTLAWNRADVASDYVFAEKRRLDPSALKLEARMMDALINDRVDFVQLLLANGVTMETFLTPARLERLYNQSDKAAMLLAAMEDVVPRARYHGYRYTLPDIGEVMRHLMGGVYDAAHYRHGKISSIPFNDLFIWAVLTKRHTMALFMWNRGYEAMAKALVAIKLNCSLSKEAAESPNEEMCEEFDNYADDFRRRSLQLLSQCCSTDDDVTLQLLTRELPNWGDETCISLAVRARHHDFVAHPACQMLLNDLWQGGLQLRKRLNQLVLISVIVPPALFFLAFKSKEELQLQAQRGEEVKPTAVADSRQEQRARVSQPLRGGTCLTLGEKLCEFYAAPITKFWVWTLAFLLFLALYTRFVLLKTPESLDSWQEWYIVAYAAVVGCDLLREAFMGQPKHIGYKFLSLVRRRWNLTSALAVFMLFTATALRGGGSEMVDAVRLVYVCNIVIWYTRLLDIMGINALLGPYIIMFGQTLLSFLYLSTIFAVLLTSYGITAQSIRQQNQTQWEWRFLRDVVYQPYFMIFGEIFAPTIDQCGDIGEQCVVGHWVNPIWQSAYLLVMNTLLLNLLIATFTNIFTSVNASSQTIWRYYRYNRIMEYEQKPLLPPPFTIISHFVLLVRYLLHRYFRRGSSRAFDQALKLVLNADQKRVLLNFEAKAMDEMKSANRKLTFNAPTECVTRADDKSELLVMKLNDLIAKEAVCRDTVAIVENHIQLIEVELRKKLGVPAP